jgi:6,7-dimethyl-8-ribityllumazine synthase
MASEGIVRVMMDHTIPVGYGVLTCENHDQAQARISAGAEAVEAALQCAKIQKSLK